MNQEKTNIFFKEYKKELKRLNNLFVKETNMNIKITISRELRKHIEKVLKIIGKNGSKE